MAGGGSPAPGADQGQRGGVLPLGQRGQREHPVAQRDLHVVAFPHPDEQRVGTYRGDGIAVGMGDGHLVAAQRDAEGGVGAGVDEPDPGPLPGTGGERPGRAADAAVDQVVGIPDIAGVAAEQRAAGPGHHRVRPGGPAAHGGDGDAAGMGMPLMPLIIGDGDAAAIDMPLMPWRRAART